MASYYFCICSISSSNGSIEESEVKMKKFIAVIISALSIALCSIPVQAAPAGYDQYGELADEVYNNDLDLLAALVFAESGNQDLDGMRLVADVVLNRVEDERFPATIPDVIYQPGQFYRKGSKRLKWASEHVTEACYEAVYMEAFAEERLDEKVFFYCAGAWQPYGYPAYKHGAHYFNYY